MQQVIKIICINSPSPINVKRERAETQKPLKFPKHVCKIIFYAQHMYLCLDFLFVTINHLNHLNRQESGRHESAVSYCRPKGLSIVHLMYLCPRTATNVIIIIIIMFVMNRFSN